MHSIAPKFKLFVLVDPYEYWNQPETADLFYKMVALKKCGYEANYDDKVLPVDTTDFVSTHVILCASTSNQGFQPVMGYKVTLLSKAEEYDVTFPGLSLVQRAGTKKHVQAVEKIIANCKKSNRQLAYLGSWTVDPNFKNQMGMRSALRDIFIVSYCKLFAELGSPEVIIGGTIRFGTEKLFAKLGHAPLSLQGKELEPIPVAHLAGEPVQVMHTATHRPGFEPIIKKYQPLWNERESIGRKTKDVRAA